jgi:hypothetical protein
MPITGLSKSTIKCWVNDPAGIFPQTDQNIANTDRLARCSGEGLAQAH